MVDKALCTQGAVVGNAEPNYPIVDRCRSGRSSRPRFIQIAILLKQRHLPGRISLIGSPTYWEFQIFTLQVKLTHIKKRIIQ